MITLFLLACAWICTAKGLIKTSAILTYVFFLTIVLTAIFQIDSVYLLPIAVIYAAFAIIAVMRPWSAVEGEKARTTKKRWWKHPRELFGYRIMNTILFPIPLPVLSWIGGTVLETFGPFVKKRQNIMQNNLAKIIPECNNPAFMRRVWNNWGRSFVEGLKFHSYRKNMDKYVTFRNHGMLFEHPQFLLAMPHYGYMGVMALAFVNSGLTIAVTYRSPSNPLTNHILLQNYGYGYVHEAHFIPTGNAIPMVRALRDGEILNINSDQRVHGAPYIDFMGVPAKTSPGLATLARKFNLPVLIGHVERTRGVKHEIVFDEIINIPHTDDAESDEINGMKLVNSAMERVIRAKPDEYLWLHNRWA